MLKWFSENIGTIVVLILLISFLTAITISRHKAKKGNNSSCSCSGGCAGCSLACHNQSQNKG